MSRSDDVELLADGAPRELERQAARHALAAVTAALAHDINNPLNSIATNAELALLLLARKPDGQIENILRRIAEDCRRCAGVVQRLSSKLVSGPFANVELNQIAEAAARHVIAELRLPKAAVVIQRCPDDSTFAANGDGLAFACRELLLNAFFAGARTVTVRVSRMPESFKLDFIDNGPGLPEDLPQAIGAFHIGPRGLGLGLGIARRIALDHGGNLRIVSSGPSGSQFELSLPFR